MAGFFLLTRTEIYLDQPWLDLPVFIAMAAGMKWLALVLANLSDFTGFPPHVMAMVQMAILVVFASVGFAGTFRLFLVWALALLALFSAWLMTRAGISDISRVYTLTNFSTFFVFALYFNWDVDRRARKVFAANAAWRRSAPRRGAVNGCRRRFTRGSGPRGGGDSFSDDPVLRRPRGFSAIAQRPRPAIW